MSEPRSKSTKGRLAGSLRQAREAKGLSRKELADRSGLSYPYVSQLETGDREPSMDALDKLASGLDTEVATLLTSTPVETAAAAEVADVADVQGLAMPAHSVRAPLPSSPARTAASAPMRPGSPPAAPPATAGGSGWHANPGYAVASVTPPPATPAQVVDDAYRVLSALPPAQRLDAAGALLARAMRDAGRA